MPLAVRAQSPKHWTFKEFPRFCIFNCAKVILKLLVGNHTLRTIAIEPASAIQDLCLRVRGRKKSSENLSSPVPVESPCGSHGQ